MFFDKCKIVMYGVGMVGEKFWYHNCENTILEYCIDKSKHKQAIGFHGYKVLSPDTLSKRAVEGKKIVVTTDSYEEVRESLIRKGFKEFEDFIPYGLFKKKLVVIFGNCYTYYITQSLRRQKSFDRDYYIYWIEPIYMRNREKIDDNLLKNANVLLCQDIRIGNKYSDFLSLDYLKSRTNKECRVICYPNLVGFSKFLFPQLTKKEEKEYDEENKVSMMRKDRILDIGIENKWSVDKILEFAQSYSFDELDLIRLKSIAVEKYVKREKQWDIKIMEYIIDRLPNEKVMIDDYHPTNEVMEEIVKRIMNYLGLDYCYQEKDILWNMDYFIYPKVIERLQFQYRDDFIRNPQKCCYWFSNQKISFEEYVRQYVYFYS